MRSTVRRMNDVQPPDEDDHEGVDPADHAVVARLLLAESHLALARTEERVSRVETKASWLLSGLLAAFGLAALGVGKQIRTVDFDDPIDVIAMLLGAGILVALIVGAHYLTRVIDLASFGVPDRKWLKTTIVEAELGRGPTSTALTFGMAYATLDAADTSARRAVDKIEAFRPAMRLLRACGWAVIPYGVLLIIDIARSTS